MGEGKKPPLSSSISQCCFPALLVGLAGGEHSNDRGSSVRMEGCGGVDSSVGDWHSLRQWRYLYASSGDGSLAVLMAAVLTNRCVRGCQECRETAEDGYFLEAARVVNGEAVVKTAPRTWFIKSDKSEDKQLARDLPSTKEAGEAGNVEEWRGVVGRWCCVGHSWTTHHQPQERWKGGCWAGSVA